MIKKIFCLMTLLSFLSDCKLESKNKSNKKECCPDPFWSTEEECKADAGKFLQDKECCEKTFLGKGAEGQVCCGGCISEGIEETTAE